METISHDQERAARKSDDPRIRALIEACDAAGNAYGEAAAYQCHVIWQAVELCRRGKTCEADAMQPDIQKAIDRKIELQDARDAAWDDLVQSVIKKDNSMSDLIKEDEHETS